MDCEANVSSHTRQLQNCSLRQTGSVCFTTVLTEISVVSNCKFSCPKKESTAPLEKSRFLMCQLNAEAPARVACWLYLLSIPALTYSLLASHHEKVRITEVIN